MTGETEIQKVVKEVLSKKTPEIREHFFTTSAGFKLRLKPVSLSEILEAESGIEADFREQGKPIDPPTYEVGTVGGATMTEFHDATTLIVEGDEEQTKLNQEMWEKHLAALQEMSIEKAKIRQEIIMDAFDIELPADDYWMKKQQRRHIRIPDDPYDQRMHYINTIIFASPRDLVVAMIEVMRISMEGVVPEQKIKALEESFLGSISSGPGWETILADTDQKSGNEKSKVEIRSKTKRVARHKKLAETTE